MPLDYIQAYTNKGMKVIGFSPPAATYRHDIIVPCSVAQLQ